MKIITTLESLSVANGPEPSCHLLNWLLPGIAEILNTEDSLTGCRPCTSARLATSGEGDRIGTTLAASSVVLCSEQMVRKILPKERMDDISEMKNKPRSPISVSHWRTSRERQPSSKRVYYVLIMGKALLKIIFYVNLNLQPRRGSTASIQIIVSRDGHKIKQHRQIAMRVIA